MGADIRREINDFYGRFATENKIDYADAVRYLNNNEVLEWRDSVERYIEEIRKEQNPVIRERLFREYNARAYGSRITRLESLNSSIDNKLSQLYARANEQFREVLGENYTDGYYRTIYDIQNRFGYSSMFATVNDRIVENAVSYPWSGANFSDRLWKQKADLLNQLRETLTTGFIRGESVQDMARRIVKRLEVSQSNALRLIRTESSHIHNVAELDAYRECGFEEYEFMASLGEQTCEVCGRLDGKRFKLNDKQYGVNFPPLHPNCRCTTIAFDPDDNLEDMKSGELGYEEWKREFVEGKLNAPTEDNSQFSKSPRINTGSAAVFTRTPNGIKPFEITAYHADGTNNNIFISSGVKEFTKPRDIHKLDKQFTDVYKLLNVQGNIELPKICIASVDEIASNAAAAYNVVDNTLFINERIFDLPTDDFACPDNELSTILHECLHWKDAAEYRALFGAITSQNYHSEYLPYINQKSKIALDNLQKKGYNISSVSSYAKTSIVRGLFDEVYTEYRVNVILKG